jgi:hypothetical protein
METIHATHNRREVGGNEQQNFTKQSQQTHGKSKEGRIYAELVKSILQRTITKR